MRANRLKSIWASGKAANNCWLMLPSAIAAEQIAHQGWDSLTVDQEHGQCDYAAMCAMFTAISTTEAVPLVRVAWNEPGAIMQALDAGAYGVICPMIETREECEKFVGACRYAPLGYRSFGPLRAALYAGADYVEHANDTVLAIAQIESVRGLENIEAIAAVKGLDGLYLGPNDMCLSMGRLPKNLWQDAGVLAAAATVVATARAHGLKSAVYCTNVTDAQAMIAKGFDLVTVISDVGMLGAGGALRAAMA